MSNIYLDNNATTQPLSAVCERVAKVSSKCFGNPSSIHSTGYAAESIVSSARKTISEAMHAEESQLVFTSGATESNNTVFDNTLKSGGKLITTLVEHSSIRVPANLYEAAGGQVVWLPVDSDGVINLNDLQAALDDTVKLVSIQWANSETGVIQPIGEAATLCSQFETHFHSDAVQAFGKIPVNLGDVPLDSMSITAHKLHGPKGVGGLFLRDPDTPFASITGGDQELGHRAGTENVAGIAGFETAVSNRFDSFEAVASSLQNNLKLFESLILGDLPCALEGLVSLIR
jgi:cysteine desulfurase